MIGLRVSRRRMSSSTDLATSHAASNGRAGGFTIIELMVGMVLISIMVLGMNNLWFVVDDYFFRLQLRQKAVFSLTGELERLAAFGRFSSLMSLAATHGDNQATIGRWIYRADPPTVSVGFVITENALPPITSNTFNEDQVLFVNAPGNNQPEDENIIWLDRDNLITAKFEWEVLSQEQVGDCFGAGCYRIEARLSYPYRLVDNTSPAQTSMGAISTIAIRTNLGRRRP